MTANFKLPGKRQITAVYANIILNIHTKILFHILRKYFLH